jgi:hypothetical protein
MLLVTVLCADVGNDLEKQKQEKFVFERREKDCTNFIVPHWGFETFWS